MMIAYDMINIFFWYGEALLCGMLDSQYSLSKVQSILIHISREEAHNKEGPVCYLFMVWVILKITGQSLSR